MLTVITSLFRGEMIPFSGTQSCVRFSPVAAGARSQRAFSVFPKRFEERYSKKVCL